MFSTPFSAFFSNWEPFSTYTSLSTGLQKRVASFLLKKAIGHLVKDGQLDLNQIEAGVTSGRLEIRDVELEPKAVNEILPEAPFHASSVTLGSISIQIPWSNLRSGDLIVLVQRPQARLTVGAAAVRADAASSQVGLEASIASTVDNLFEEDREGRELQESLQESLHGPQGLPGAAPVAPASTSADSSEPSSVVASLVEGLLSRLKVEVSDFQVVLEDEVLIPAATHFEVETNVGNIKLRTETSFDLEPTGSTSRCKVRIVDIAGLTVWATNKRMPSQRPPLSESGMSSDESTTSSRSTDDGAEDVLRMSQAVDDLTLSVASATSRYTDVDTGSDSMYMPSGVHTSHPTPLSGAKGRRSTAPQQPARSKIVDFGDESVSVRYTSLKHALRPEGAISPTCSSAAPQSAEVISEGRVDETYGCPAPEHAGSDQSQEGTKKARKPEYALDVDIGTIAIFLDLINIQGLQEMIGHLRPPPTLNRQASEDQDAKAVGDSPLTSGSLKIESFDLLCAYEDSATFVNGEAKGLLESLEAFWKRPSKIHPPLAHVRLHFDHLHVTQSKAREKNILKTTIEDFRVTEGLRNRHSGEIQVVPILIFDEELAGPLHTGRDLHLFDWRSVLEDDSNPYQNASPLGERSWRLKPSKRRHSVSPSHRRKQSGDETNRPPITVEAILDIDRPSVKVDIGAVHLFADLSLLLRVMPLLHAFDRVRHSPLTPTPQELLEPGDSTETLGMDQRSGQGGQSAEKTSPVPVSISCQLLRLEIRIPDGKDKRSSALRSGILALDVEELDVSLNPSESNELLRSQSTPAHRVHYAESAGARSSSRRDRLIADISARSLFTHFQPAGSTQAEKVAVLTHLTEDDGQEAGQQNGQPRLPRVCLSQATGEDSITSITKCTFPLLDLSLSKLSLDGLQLLADDFATWSGELSRVGDSLRDEGDDIRILGSRFFHNSRSGLSSEVADSIATLQQAEAPKELTVFSLELTEVRGRALVPRLEQIVGLREFRLTGQDLKVNFNPLPNKKTAKLDVSVLVFTLDELVQSQEGRFQLLAPTLQQSLTRGVSPMVSLTMVLFADTDSSHRESRIEPLFRDFTITLTEDMSLFQDLAQFVKSPAGAFENVEPNELTRMHVKAKGISVLIAPTMASERLVVILGDLSARSRLVGGAPRSSLYLTLSDTSIFLVDKQDACPNERKHRIRTIREYWSSQGFANIVELAEVNATVTTSKLTLPDVDVKISKARGQIKACADTLAALINLITSLSPPPVQNTPLEDSGEMQSEGGSSEDVTGKTQHDILAGIDENAFRVDTDGLTSIPDLLEDDIPSRPEFYGVPRINRQQEYEETPLTEEDFFGSESAASLIDPVTSGSQKTGKSEAVVIDSDIVTVRLLDEAGLRPSPAYFSRPDLLPKRRDPTSGFASSFRLRIEQCDISLHLFAGYDWAETRTEIEAEIKRVRRRLQKIKQLLDEGQKADDSVEDAILDLSESIHIAFDPAGDATAALNVLEDETGPQSETASSASTWQPLPRSHGRYTSSGQGTPLQGRRRSKLERSHASLLEFVFQGIGVEFNQMIPSAPLVSHLNVQVNTIQILDHIKTSSWHAFLIRMSEKSPKSRTGAESKMLRVQLLSIRSPDHDEGEYRMRAKVSPLRLHIDQDALEFLQKFFAFKRPSQAHRSGFSAASAEAAPTSGPFIQYAEIYPIKLKADYKPKRVNYSLLRQGRVMELMNFFHFDGAETTLRHVTLRGITGWPKLFDTLNDIWTPDVKTYQMADVLAGIAPVRSIVNVGSGVADMILIPIEQLQKDGRLGLGLRKGAGRFAKVTALEVLKLGARLATGTQGLLEKAEQALGAGEARGTSSAGGGSNMSYTRRRTVTSPSRRFGDEKEDEDDSDAGSDFGQRIPTADTNIPLINDEEYGFLISKFADQPSDVREALSQAYHSLRSGANAAAQTILAVPMEIYEGSSYSGGIGIGSVDPSGTGTGTGVTGRGVGIGIGSGGGGGGGGGSSSSGKTVIKAVPIAVVQGAKGASEALARTLMGLRGILEPGMGEEKEKYKR